MLQFTLAFKATHVDHPLNRLFQGFRFLTPTFHHLIIIMLRFHFQFWQHFLFRAHS